MKVYLVYMNSDMTEGRGPMTLVRVMKDRDEAVEYALSKPGVMGVLNRQTECHVQTKVGSWIFHQLGVRIVDGDWEVIEVEAI